MSFSQEEVQARSHTCLSGLRQLLSQVPDWVLMFPVCISSPFKYAPSDIAEHPHMGRLLSLYRTWGRTNRGDFPRKTNVGDGHKSSPGTLNLWGQPTLTLWTYQVTSKCQKKLLVLFLRLPSTQGSSVWASHLCLFHRMQGRISTRLSLFSKEIPVCGSFSCIWGGNDGKCQIKGMTFWRYKLSP